MEKMRLVRTLAEAYTAAWCRHDAAGVATHYEENGSLSVNDDAPAVGREAIAKIAQGFMNDFPDMQVFLDDLVFRDGEVIYHWTLIRSSGRFFGENSARLWGSDINKKKQQIQFCKAQGQGCSKVAFNQGMPRTALSRRR